MLREYTRMSATTSLHSINVQSLVHLLTEHYVLVYSTSAVTTSLHSINRSITDTLTY